MENNDNKSYDQYNMYYGKNPTCGSYNDIANRSEQCIDLRDHGPMPYVVNIHEAANQNYNFRLALWTGVHLQLTLMNISAGEDVGLEVHPNVDQFLRIEEGTGLVLMGDSKDNLWFQKNVYPGYVIFVPAKTWHNIINTGCTPLKLYSIYAPPNHPYGTIHRTKQDDMEHEHY
ncbi:MAG: cupin domain-containing protein [Gottschalkiaceae bacterium]|nr:MAG: cupin domain-containing protein [Gottschalkiaceae bacterium]